MQSLKQSEKQMRRRAARRLNRIFNHYARQDVDATTRQGALKVLGCWAVQEIGLNTLADRPVHCQDKPTKMEAADALKQLLVNVPNNLTPEQVSEALGLVKLMSAARATGSDLKAA
jgi:hypothetical protein